jgi:hypothetical protein
LSYKMNEYILYVSLCWLWSGCDSNGSDLHEHISEVIGLQCNENAPSHCTLYRPGK